MKITTEVTENKSYFTRDCCCRYAVECFGKSINKIQFAVLGQFWSADDIIIFEWSPKLSSRLVQEIKFVRTDRSPGTLRCLRKKIKLLGWIFLGAEFSQSEVFFVEIGV